MEHVYFCDLFYIAIAILFYFGLCIVIFGYFDAFKYLFHLIPTTLSNKFKKISFYIFNYSMTKVAMWVK